MIICYSIRHYKDEPLYNNLYCSCQEMEPQESEPITLYGLNAEEKESYMLNHYQTRFDVCSNEPGMQKSNQ